MGIHADVKRGVPILEKGFFFNTYIHTHIHTNMYNDSVMWLLKKESELE